MTYAHTNRMDTFRQKMWVCHLSGHQIQRVPLWFLQNLAETKILTSFREKVFLPQIVDRYAHMNPINTFGQKNNQCHLAGGTPDRAGAGPRLLQFRWKCKFLIKKKEFGPKIVDTYAHTNSIDPFRQKNDVCHTTDHEIRRVPLRFWPKMSF